MSETINKAVKGVTYDALRKELLKTPKNSKVTYAEKFISAALKEAIEHPNSPVGQQLTKQIFQDDILTNLDSETERLLARDKDFAEYRIYKQCYKEQRDVLLDDHSKFILVNTSRRTGKTNLAARWLIKKCVSPNSPCYYYHIKFDNAIRQCFDLCIEAAEKAELPIASQSKSEGIIVFDNGSFIKFCGNSNKAEADKSRGFSARAIVIDEAAFQVNEKYLVEDIITPMMADYPDSQLMMVSTPPRIPKTYYEECYNSTAWTKYEWDATKNPFIPPFREFIAQVCKSKGITIDSPFIQREFFGKFYYDTEAMVFKDYKTYTKIPEKFHATHIYIGCDFGFSDYNAVVPVIADSATKTAIVLNSKKFNKSTVSTIAAEIMATRDQAIKTALETNSNLDLSNVYVVCDTNEKSISYELYKTYNIPNVCNAYKHDKQLAITQLAEWCRTGIISIKDNDEVLKDEFSRTVYKRNEDDSITAEIADELFHPDAMDALLYASRIFCFHMFGNNDTAPTAIKNVEGQVVLKNTGNDIIEDVTWT